MQFRKEIRDAAQARILAEMPGDFTEVSIGRRNRVPKKKLPACCIYTDGEEIEPITIQSPRLLSRQLELVIRIFVKEGATDADDALDALAYAVEDALSSSGRLGLTYVKNIVIAAWEVEGEEEDADDKYLAGTLTFTCTYEALETT